MFMYFSPHIKATVVIVQRSLPRCGSVEGLCVGRCVVRSRQRISVIGFLRWRRVRLKQEGQQGEIYHFDPTYSGQ